ncbi:hypothetical protein G6011_07551 [Alternaria panax]|uniref:Uncharacterized protein n=1 Tax=Alternaria panax TaxID=48097 RepID=A0AAD4I941_9PLEO|nr:hypothetical protein G6011_07551 [Alternaria panax]
MDSYQLQHYAAPRMSSSTVTAAGSARPSASSDSNSSATLHGSDIQTKDKSSLRRWFNGVRKAVFSSGAQKQSENFKESLVRQIFTSPAASNVNVANVEPPTMVESAAVLERVARNQQTSSVPASAVPSASASAPALAPVNWCMAELDQATPAPTLPSNSTNPNDNTTMRTKPAKVKRTRKPRRPTMITPSMLEKLAKDNKKHHGATAVRQAEVRKSNAGTSSSAPRASGVQASPMRWSQD